MTHAQTPIHTNPLTDTPRNTHLHTHTRNEPHAALTYCVACLDVSISTALGWHYTVIRSLRNTFMSGDCGSALCGGLLPVSLDASEL